MLRIPSRVVLVACTGHDVATAAACSRYSQGCAGWGRGHRHRLRDTARGGACLITDAPHHAPKHRKYAGVGQLPHVCPMSPFRSAHTLCCRSNSKSNMISHHQIGTTQFHHCLPELTQAFATTLAWLAVPQEAVVCPSCRSDGSTILWRVWNKA